MKLNLPAAKEKGVLLSVKMLIMIFYTVFSVLKMFRTTIRLLCCRLKCNSCQYTLQRST